MISPRVGDDAVTNTNRGAHRFRRHFKGLEARLVHGVHGRRSEGIEDNDNCKKRISEPRKRNGGFRLLRGGGGAGGFGSDENLPREQDQNGGDHRPEVEKQTRVSD